MQSFCNSIKNTTSQLTLRYCWGHSSCVSAIWHFANTEWCLSILLFLSNIHHHIWMDYEWNDASTLCLHNFLNQKLKPGQWGGKLCKFITTSSWSDQAVVHTWVSEGGPWSLWILKISARVVFLVSSGKKNVTTFIPPRKFQEKSASCPHGKILPTPTSPNRLLCSYMLYLWVFLRYNQTTKLKTKLK